MPGREIPPCTSSALRLFWQHSAKNRASPPFGGEARIHCLQGGLQGVRHVGVLPGEIHIGAAEVAVGGGLPVDGAAEIQVESRTSEMRSQALMLSNQLAESRYLTGEVLRVNGGALV